MLPIYREKKEIIPMNTFFYLQWSSSLLERKKLIEPFGFRNGLLSWHIFAARKYSFDIIYICAINSLISFYTVFEKWLKCIDLFTGFFHCNFHKILIFYVTQVLPLIYGYEIGDNEIAKLICLQQNLSTVSFWSFFQYCIHNLIDGVICNKSFIVYLLFE